MFGKLCRHEPGNHQCDDGNDNHRREQSDGGREARAGGNERRSRRWARHLTQCEARRERRDFVHPLVAAGPVRHVGLCSRIGGGTEDAEQRPRRQQQRENQHPVADPAQQRRHGSKREEEHRDGKAQHADCCDPAPAPDVRLRAPVRCGNNPDRGGKREDCARSPVRQAKLAREWRQHGRCQHRISGADGEEAEEEEQKGSPSVWPRYVVGGASIHGLG